LEHFGLARDTERERFDALCVQLEHATVLGLHDIQGALGDHTQALLCYIGAVRAEWEDAALMGEKENR
jgi:hypothetical protein